MQSSPRQAGPHQIPLLHSVPVDSASQQKDSFNIIMKLSALVSKKGSPPQKLAGGCRNINSSELELVEHIPRVPWCIEIAADGSTLERSARSSMRRIALLKHAQ